ncbi:hypothetical protein SPHINGO391_350417 [Sphingomonas aurantiaca]|uniref:Uncharacterized protein n=1 Tax=Sphingomonas aurantiaca TaxID=185949 RepID=A0A5E7Y8P5_9SPHN|nr:hypothetical protein SPHINGO391_350417 [Sphingomonas aurantiaca]
MRRLLASRLVIDRGDGHEKSQDIAGGDHGLGHDGAALGRHRAGRSAAGAPGLTGPKFIGPGRTGASDRDPDAGPFTEHDAARVDGARIEMVRRHQAARFFCRQLAKRHLVPRS